jgi:hypothetical protein
MPINGLKNSIFGASQSLCQTDLAPCARKIMSYDRPTGCVGLFSRLIDT